MPLLKDGIKYGSAYAIAREAGKALDKHEKNKNTENVQQPSQSNQVGQHGNHQQPERSGFGHTHQAWCNGQCNSQCGVNSGKVADANDVKK